MLEKITQEVFDSILNDPDRNFDGYIIGKDITFPEEIRNQAFTHCEFEPILSGIKFTNVIFNYVDFNVIGFTDCTFNHCHFNYCSLRYESFTSCDFVTTEFTLCNLVGVNIYECSMVDVYFTCSRLSSTVFVNTKALCVQFYSCAMNNCESVDSNITFPRHVPSEGSFIAWKKANSVHNAIIIKLRILEDAKRFCTNNKCRADKVEVLGFETLDGEKLPDDTIAHSFWNPRFKYHTGFIEVYDFNDNPQVECGGGIHFFLSRDDAVNYVF